MGNVASDCLSQSKTSTPTTAKSPQPASKKKQNGSDSTLLTAPTLLTGNITPNRLLKGSSLCSEESREPVTEAMISVEMLEMASGSWSLDDAPPTIAAQLSRIRRHK
ncbi:Hypothetical protein, putative [Bodo saltans]|uniref:Uncharacterized protein n=1 Tax=Bodo saltans TaxID=75058 RepID=A0A0S4JAX6_BODSA|nr:Hypothetical protein, putative [Bodo saltans]|eukprot:CUG83807.1 Hypothetical protein, putative [Bodo saltans]